MISITESANLNIQNNNRNAMLFMVPQCGILSVMELLLHTKININNNKITDCYIISECIYKPGHHDAVKVICTSSSVMVLLLKEIY